METNRENVRSIGNTRSLVIDGLFIALTLVVTMFINIRLPLMGSGGLIHLGNVPLFIAAIVYGKRTGALAGAFGMGLFDLISGWTAWAPFTFVICGAIGYAVGAITQGESGNSYIKYIVAVIAACIIKITGYYFAEVFLYGNWIAPFGSVPGNIMQIVVAGIIVFPVAKKLKKIVGNGGK